MKTSDFSAWYSGILLSLIAKAMVLNKYATWQNKEVKWMAWIASCWKLVLCLTAPILAIALLLYILAKFGYEFKLGNKKVEVTRRKETPTKTKH